MKLINGDCLEKLKELQAKPVEESLAQPQVKKSRKKNADSSTKRKSKKTTKTTSRE